MTSSAQSALGKEGILFAFDSNHIRIERCFYFIVAFQFGASMTQGEVAAMVNHRNEVFLS